VGSSEKVLKLTFMSRYFIGSATAAGAVASLRKGTSALPGAAADAVTGCANDPFKFFRLAMGAFELHFIPLFHHQNFEAIIAF